MLDASVFLWARNESFVCGIIEFIHYIFTTSKRTVIGKNKGICEK